MTPNIDERADITSDQYNDWLVHNDYLEILGIIASEQFIATFKELSPQSGARQLHRKSRRDPRYAASTACKQRKGLGGRKRDKIEPLGWVPPR